MKIIDDNQNKSISLQKRKSIMEEIFKSNLTLSAKVELASKLAMEQVNKVIQKHIDKFRKFEALEKEFENRRNIVSVKYEDTDLYRLEQKAKMKREITNKIDKLSKEDLEDLKYLLENIYI